MNRSNFAHEIAPTPTEIVRAAEAQSIIGEGPVWSAAERCLYFVDIPRKVVHRWRDAATPLESFGAPEIVTSVAPRRSGGLIASMKRGLATLDTATGAFELLPDIAREPKGNRFNDGKCDRLGRFWAGTMSIADWDAPLGTLYRFGADRLPVPMVEKVRCSNGLGWSPDNRIFYFVESFAHTILAFDYEPESGEIANRRVFASLDPVAGAFPDGLTVDREGFVWNAQPVFGRLVRYDPDGGLDRIVEMPVSRPTSLAFGGDDLGTLYVTSARDSLSPAQLVEEPMAGDLFALRPGVAGIAETPFVG